MIRMFVRHKVGNFTTWKRGYDSFDATRRRLGVREAAVFHGASEPEDVTVWHDFDTIEAAQAFAKSSELAGAMQRAGVVGTPEIWFASRELRA